MTMKRISEYLLLLFASCLLWGMAGCTGGLVEEQEESEERFIELRFGRPGLEIAPVTRSGETSPLPSGSTVRIAAYRRMNNEPDLLSADLPMVDLSTALPAYQATYLVDEEGFLLPCVVDAEGKQTIGTSQEMTVLAGVYDFYAVSPARPLTKVDGKQQITGIPHQEDVMTSFVWGVAVSQASRQVSLQAFQRKCAQVVLK